VPQKGIALQIVGAEVIFTATEKIDEKIHVRKVVMHVNIACPAKNGDSTCQLVKV